MLAHVVPRDPYPDPAAPPAIRDEFLAPDAGVVDSARHRIAARLARTAGRNPGEMPRYPIDDVRAVNAVIDAAHDDAEQPADALDLGAALVMLCNLRLYLDRLEVNLLDGAQQVGLGWDVIAAILGIPAAEAQQRHVALRTRVGPQ